MELIDGIPFGLIACFVDGVQVSVKAISEDQICLRLADETVTKMIWMHFLSLSQGVWTRVQPGHWRVLTVQRDQCGWVMRLAIDDSSYRRAVRQALAGYAGYIRGKMQGDDGELAARLTGFPNDEITAQTFTEQKAKWLSNICGFSMPGDWTLALAVDRPEAYERFVTMPFERFQTDFFRRSYLEQHALFDRRAERVYLGNACCAQLFPECISGLVEQAKRQGVQSTVVLPPVRESRRRWLEQVLLEAENAGADEAEVNDWGTLEVVRQGRIKPILGIQLNRRRKDPRMNWKIGFERQGAVLSENALNDPAFQKWLRDRMVERYEYEPCGYPVHVATGRHSLHLPFYQTNTSDDCPLASYCERTDPGRPRPDRGCFMYCQDHALLYPNSMRLVGRGNTLFGLDDDIMRQKDALQRWMDQGIDRLVANLL